MKAFVRIKDSFLDNFSRILVILPLIPKSVIDKLIVKCFKCSKMLESASFKEKLNDGSIICGDCYEVMKRHKDKDRTIMVDFIKKYLSKRKMGEIQGVDEKIYIMCKYEHDNCFYSRVEENELSVAIDYCNNQITEAEYSIKSGLSCRELDGIIHTKKLMYGYLDTLKDLETIYRLFIHKGIETNYFEILDIFYEISIINLKCHFDAIINPLESHIKEKISNDIRMENVVKAFLEIVDTKKTGLSWLLKIQSIFPFMDRLCEKFDLQYDEIEGQKIIKEYQEKMELQEFEQNLGKFKTEIIGDYLFLSGYEFEAYLSKLFSLKGYTVIHTSLSGDQGADLVISKNNEKIVVQAKKQSGKVSNKAIQEIVAAKNHYNANKAIVITNSTFTKSAIELALSNEVELWDGLKLDDKIREINC